MNCQLLVPKGKKTGGLFGCFLKGRGCALVGQGADRTHCDALSALATDGLANRFVLKGRDPSLKTPSGKANHSDTELLLADPHAFATEDALVGIVGEEWTAFVDGKVSFDLSESFRDELDAKMMSDSLKFAGSVFQTMTAINGVISQDQLGCSTGKPQSIFPPCANDHALLNSFGAGNHGFVLPFHFHKTEATRGRRFRFFLDGTKVGNIDAVLQCRPEDHLPFAAQNLFAIDRQR